MWLLQMTNLKRKTDHGGKLTFISRIVSDSTYLNQDYNYYNDLSRHLIRARLCKEIGKFQVGNTDNEKYFD